MFALRPPEGLKFGGNLSEDFRRFKQAFEIYLTAAGLDSKPDEVKLALLLLNVGDDGFTIYDSLDLNEEDKQSYEKVLKAFQAYCIPKRNIILERFIFNKRVQLENESFLDFLTDLKRLARSCEFGDSEDSLVRDRIIIGINDNDLRENLLLSSDTSLDKIVEMCRADEMRKQIVAELQLSRLHKTTNTRNNVNSNRQEVNTKYLCKKCNRRHARFNCPAFGKRCNFCNGLNHFQVGCLKKKRNKIIMPSDDDSDEEVFVIF